MTPNLNLSYLSTAQSQKEVTINQSLLMLDTAVAGRLVKDLTTAGPAVVLTPLECINPFLVFSGEPAQPVTVTVVAKTWQWVIENAASGPHSAVSLKTADGAAIVIAGGSKAVVFCNGSEVGFLGGNDEALDALEDAVADDLAAMGTRVANLEEQRPASSLVSRLVKDISGLGDTFALTEAEANSSLLTFVGGTTGAVTVIVPADARSWTLENKTLDARLTVKTQGGAGIFLPQVGTGASYTVQAYCDGVDVKPLGSNRADYHFQFAGMPAARQMVGGYISPGKMLMPKALANPIRAGVAPVMSPSFGIYVIRNGQTDATGVGSGNMGASPPQGAISAANDLLLNEGDFVYVQAPANPDAAMADIFGTLTFIRLD